MVKPDNPLISIVVPVHNESPGLESFHKTLVDELKHSVKKYEVIYVDDGSSDDSARLIEKWVGPHIRLICLSRNFGKELATTAGIHKARGDAIITIDADGQHPVSLIGGFITKWQAGAKVVVGLRTANQDEGLVKHFGSRLFYKFFNRFTGLRLIPGSTDFRLIDRSVQTEFIRMTERNRITRGLIDWLGYRREFIEFKANARLAGDATYSFGKLFKLAINSVVSLSISPLYITAYIGAIVLPVSLLLGLVMVINTLVRDPLHLHATGTAYVTVLILCLIGILMMSQGIIGLYLSHIHTETQNRPLYIIDYEKGGNDKAVG